MFYEEFQLLPDQIPSIIFRFQFFSHFFHYFVGMDAYVHQFATISVFIVSEYLLASNIYSFVFAVA